jgi:hypothetical protein
MREAVRHQLQRRGVDTRNVTSEVLVRAAKPNFDKGYKVADGGGLYLLIK